MLNGAGSMHGGCSAYLIDLCVLVVTPLFIYVLPLMPAARLWPFQLTRRTHMDRPSSWSRKHLTSSTIPLPCCTCNPYADLPFLNSSSCRGDRIRIVNTSIALGARASSARTEVRLCLPSALTDHSTASSCSPVHRSGTTRTIVLSPRGSISRCSRPRQRPRCNLSQYMPSYPIRHILVEFNLKI